MEIHFTVLMLLSTLSIPEHSSGHQYYKERRLDCRYQFLNRPGAHSQPPFLLGKRQSAYYRRSKRSWILGKHVNTSQVYRAGKALCGNDFGGVFAVSQLTSLSKSHGWDTDSSLPGKPWIGNWAGQSWQVQYFYETGRGVTDMMVEAFHWLVCGL